MTHYPASPLHLLRTLWRHRQLIADMAWRDALGRYRGSALGVLWPLVTPIVMLSIYTFVFSEIFQARWHGGSSSKLEFAIVLFAGLIVFNLFAEMATRAPGLVIANANFVKKVVFPLEILACVSLLSALFHAVISLAVLLVFQALVGGGVPLTALWLPLVLAPLLLFCLGMSWLLSALGVYLRDVGQTVGLAVTGLMFLSPVFFPLSSIPASWRWVARLNPLVFPIEQARSVLIWGSAPDWREWCLYTLAALLLAWLGFACFQKTRRGFADVL